MKILLIYPPFRTEVSSLARVLKNKVPPLGLGYIASALEIAGHEVKIIDAETDNLDLLGVIKAAKEFNPELIGLSTTTITFHKAREAAEKIKEELDNIKIVLGGPHLVIFPEITLKFKCFDYGVINEGELTIVDLAKAIENNADTQNVEGIVYRQGDEVKVTQPRQFIQNLDESPQVAWHLLSLGKYQDVLAKKRTFASMITTRGCPYNCIYCERDCRLGRTYRMRSVKSVIDELDTLYNKYNIQEIIFYDDTFTVDKKRTIELCNEITKKDWNIIWECRTRVDLVDEELIKIMKKAGCYRIRFGVEAGNEEILKVLKKNINKEQIKRAFKLCKQYKIETFAYFMIGSPQETKETVKESINFSIELDADYVMFSPTQLHGQGTDLFQWAVEHGHIDKDYWKKWVSGEKLESFPLLSTTELSSADVIKYVKYGYRKFYFRPKSIFRMLGKVRNFYTLQKYTFIALNMLSKKFAG
ncbi:B12-binding domain-containing radical SAM protein [Patescibacteria group bacterium]|nr:B12-binding domain-containing radical SAM protein [Patescibacteria group bacterium]